MADRIALMQEDKALRELYAMPGWTIFSKLWGDTHRELLGQLRFTDPTNAGTVGKLQGKLDGMELAYNVIAKRLNEIDRDLGRKDED